MPITKTRGNSFVLPANGASGGLYLDIWPEDLALANFDGVELWLDGKSVTTPGATLGLRDRIAGRAALAYDITMVPGGSGRGDLAFSIPPASSARIHVPAYTLPNEYMIAMIVTPPDGSANTAKVLAQTTSSETNWMRTWLEQTAPGAVMNARIRNDGDGGISTAGDNFIPPLARSLIWFGQRSEDGRVYVGSGLTHKTQSSGAEEERIPVPGLFLGGAGTNLSFGGLIEAAAVVSGPMSSLNTSSSAVRRREDFLRLFAARYGITL